MIRTLIGKCNSCVVFRKREPNLVAHNVASLALNGVGKHIWENNAPFGVWDRVMLDLVGCNNSFP